jgi:ferredoxin
MKVTVDPTRCMASGNCVLTLPSLFEQDENGFARLREVDANTLPADKIEEAATSCPTAAISFDPDA